MKDVSLQSEDIFSDQLQAASMIRLRFFSPKQNAQKLGTLWFKNILQSSNNRTY